MRQVDAFKKNPQLRDIYLISLFICIVSVHLVVSLKLRSLLYCVAVCMHCIHFWEKALFTSLLICIVSVHLITCTRCTLFLFLLIPCFVRFNIVETFAWHHSLAPATLGKRTSSSGHVLRWHTTIVFFQYTPWIDLWRWTYRANEMLLCWSQILLCIDSTRALPSLITATLELWHEKNVERPWVVEIRAQEKVGAHCKTNDFQFFSRSVLCVGGVGSSAPPILSCRVATKKRDVPPTRVVAVVLGWHR
jgi:hypothetical protein